MFLILRNIWDYTDKFRFAEIYHINTENAEKRKARKEETTCGKAAGNYLRDLCALCG